MTAFRKSQIPNPKSQIQSKAQGQSFKRRGLYEIRGAVSKVVNVYFVVSLVLPLVSFAVPICRNFMAFNHQEQQGKPKGRKGFFDTAPRAVEK
jgi:hypothetical protein